MPNHAHNTLRRAATVWSEGELELSEVGRSIGSQLGVFCLHLDSSAVVESAVLHSVPFRSLFVVQGSDDTESSQLQLASLFRCGAFGN